MNTVSRLSVIYKTAALCAGLCWVSPGNVTAALSTYEQELMEALALRVERGEPVWLDAIGERFLGIYYQQHQGKVRGAAIIVHGMGAHPDWPAVISPLRQDLTAGGWTTLSIQMPVLEPGDPLSGYGDTVKRAGNRIRTAIRFLHDRNFLNVVIIGHGFGATAGAGYLAETGNDIQAFVGISMQSYDFLNPRQDLLASLERLEIPVLDLYASRDFVEVLRLVEDRRLAARKMNRQHYQQIEIDGADHNFTGLEEVMARRIRGWLDKAAPGLRAVADPELNSRDDADRGQDRVAE